MSSALLHSHLAGGLTTVCRAWRLTRKDGLVLGFTDHDRDLDFDGTFFRAETGLTARTLQLQNGLSVDNSEAQGGFSDEAISAEDLAAGRFDGAKVRGWLVNWQDVVQRQVIFAGHLGEIRHAEGRFSAELRSHSDLLNQPRGRIFQRACGAVLGDASCGFNLEAPGFGLEAALEGVDAMGRLVLTDDPTIAPGFFARGRADVIDGAAAGLGAVVKSDRVEGGKRLVELWQGFGVAPAVGDTVRLYAGCDQQAATCRDKFANFTNFRGFPHIPGEDWVMSYPVAGQGNDGGSLYG